MAQYIPQAIPSANDANPAPLYLPNGVSVHEVDYGHFEQISDKATVGQYMKFRRQNMSKHRYVEGVVLQYQDGLQFANIGLK